MAIDKVSIKDIQRQFGMCYTTAWRMYHAIENSKFYVRLASVESHYAYQMISKDVDIKINSIPHPAAILNRKKKQFKKINKNEQGDNRHLDRPIKKY